MEPTFVEREAFAIAGVVARGQPGALDYGAIWGALDRHLPALAPLSLDGAYYSAYFGTEQPEVVEMISGMAVTDVQAPVPAGLSIRAVPAARYAVFPCTVGTIGQTYGFIYGGWQPPAGQEVDHSRPGLEIYPPDGGGGHDDPCAIHVPLRRAS